MTTVTAPTTTTVTVSTRELKHAITTASRAVSKKSLIPLLEGLCFTLKGQSLRVRGTNLELGISSSGVSIDPFEGDIPSIEEFVVSATMLNDVLAPMNDDQVHLTFNPLDGTLLIATKRCKSTVRAITDHYQKNFPPVDSPSAERTFIGTIDCSKLKRVLGRVAYAASDDESRQALTGVLLDIKEGAASLVAADGYRLACHALPLVVVGESDARLIIPPRTLRELVRVVDGEVEIHQIQGGNQVSFTPLTGEPTLVLSRLIDGKFPDYSRIIPTEHFARAAVGPQDFLRAIKSVTPFAREASNHVTITFREGELLLNTNTTEVGSGEATVPAQVNGATEEELRIALNGLFIRDALDGLKNEAEVWVEMQEPSKPLVITIPPVDKTGSEYTHVIMPMTLR